MRVHPLISIVTVCYNAADVLQTTLQSAIDQSFQDFELVIIDGGSKDDTVRIAKQFSAKIGTLISEPDKGIYDAMNKGIAHAKGEWIYFLNAGDCFYNNAVLANVFNQPIPDHIGLLYGKVQTINEPTGINYVSGSEVSLRDFYSRYPINHQATFTRKSAFDVLGGYHTAYRLAADTEWFIRLFKSRQFEAKFVDQIVAYYDIQGASYHKRMQGYKEYLTFSATHFPMPVVIKNYLFYPLIWIKVKLIRMLTDTHLFKLYRRYKHHIAANTP